MTQRVRLTLGILTGLVTYTALVFLLADAWAAAFGGPRMTPSQYLVQTAFTGVILLGLVRWRRRRNTATAPTPTAR